MKKVVGSAGAAGGVVGPIVAYMVSWLPSPNSDS